MAVDGVLFLQYYGRSCDYADEEYFIVTGGHIHKFGTAKRFVSNTTPTPEGLEFNLANGGEVFRIYNSGRRLNRLSFLWRVNTQVNNFSVSWIDFNKSDSVNPRA